MIGTGLIDTIDARPTCDFQTLWFGLNMDWFYVARYLNDLNDMLALQSTRGPTSNVLTRRCFVTEWKHRGHRQWSLNHIWWLVYEVGQSVGYSFQLEVTHYLDQFRVSHPTATLWSPILVMGRSSEWVSGNDCICSEMEAWGLRAAAELADRMAVVGCGCRVHPRGVVDAPFRNRPTSQ